MFVFADIFLDEPGAVGCGANCLNRLLMIEWLVLLCNSDWHLMLSFNLTLE